MRPGPKARLYQNSTGVWELHISWPGTGKRLRRSLRTKSETEARGDLAGLEDADYARYEAEVFGEEKTHEHPRLDEVSDWYFEIKLPQAGAASNTIRNYRMSINDFMRYAKSPSFLIYELWDRLTDDWVAVHETLSSRVLRLQEKLIHRFDDRVFGRVAELNSDLLELRKILVPAREVLSELSSRHSPFISEETRPFLANMAGTVERIVQDLNVDRDILSNSIALYMSMISYRTNRVMTRLTVVSVVFLPLMFLCGVYGMNFRELPETKWKFGYLFFWILALTMTGGLIALLRRASRL